ncbi:MAG: phosphotransferase [Myxococcota bacterium]
MREVTGASRIRGVDRIQSLWRGWGDVLRVELAGADVPSVVVKVVRGAPVGRRLDPGDARKVRSYEVEAAFYRHWSARCLPAVRVPRCRFATPGFFVLEDLDAAGFRGRRPNGSDGLEAVVPWLARLHARFLGDPDPGRELWPEGCYWHLATRGDELRRMADGPLKRHAAAIDAKLRGARHQTLVHGDAKLANFCFAADGACAGVDFQYVGRGPGIRDLAYLLWGVSDRELESGVWEDLYFTTLREAGGGEAEDEWRALLPFAWADFERFLAGWAPGHRERESYADRTTARVLAQLEGR